MAHHRHQGGPPPNKPPIPSYASKVSGAPPLKQKLFPVFVDPLDGHLALLPVHPREHLVELVNPKAIAYNIPKTSLVSGFTAAARSTHSTLIASLTDLVADMAIISSRVFVKDHHTRVEIVYHEALDAALVSTTPVLFNNITIPPLSSTIDYIITKLFISNFQFQSSNDLGPGLCTWIKDLIEGEKEMGKVIKIEVPLRPSSDGIHSPDHHVYVYVKGTRTPEDVSLGHTHELPGHQKTPVSITWSNPSGPPFCNYCKTKGHLIGTCVHRLSVLCAKCNVQGHHQTQCEIFSERDRKAAKGKGREIGPIASVAIRGAAASNISAGASSSGYIPTAVGPSSSTSSIISSTSIISSAMATASSTLPAPAAFDLLLAANAAGTTSSSSSSPPFFSPSILVSTHITDDTLLPEMVSQSNTEESVVSPEVILCTPENEMFPTFSDGQAKEILALTDYTRKGKENKGKAARNDYNKRVIESSSDSASTPVFMVRETRTNHNPKLIKRGKTQDVHTTYVSSSSQSTFDEPSLYPRSPGESQVFVKQKVGFMKTMQKSMKKAVSNIVSPPTSSPSQRTRSRTPFTPRS